jgi:lysylphosphatidylglycerol synthetase-like protein (DUF2156 family)
LPPALWRMAARRAAPGQLFLQRSASDAELEHFGDERGFLVYKKVGTSVVALFDPIAPLGNIPDLIARFLQKHPDARFWYLSPQVARILAGRGFVRESRERRADAA